MSGLLTKRRLAAALCAALLCLLAAAAALAEEATPDTARMFSLSLEVEEGGVCTITVSNAQSFPITVNLLNESGDVIGSGGTEGNGVAQVSLTQSGTYHAVGWFDRYPDVKVSSAEVGYTQPRPEPQAIAAEVTVEGQSICVTVTQAENRELSIAVGGQTVSAALYEAKIFSDLPAGEYTVTVNYAQEPRLASPFSAQRTVAAPVITATQFAIAASAAEDGTVSVSITGAANLPLEARLFRKDTGEQVGQTQTCTGDGALSFGQPGAGEYVVSVNYQTPAEGVSAQSAEVTVAQQGGGSEVPQVMSLRIVPSAPAMSTGSIEGSITFTGDRSMVAKLYNNAGEQVGEVTIPVGGDGRFAFANLAAGEYLLSFYYYGEGAAPVLSLTYTVQEQLPTATAIVATAAAGVERIDVSVTTATAIPVTVTLRQGDAAVGSREIAAGMGNVSFEGLSAGTYSLSIDYTTKQTGIEPTVIGGLNVIAARAPITDLAAVAGENQISITGRAQPNADVTLTTEPASATAIVRADERGSFTTTIVCAAGTYTAVCAQYGAESETRVTLNGSFVVTAPAVKPTLEVDPIANNALTVIAKTTPGVKVNLSTGDYAQTVTADANGLMRYSLPHTYPTGTVVTFTVKYGVDNVQSYQQTVTVGEPARYILLRRGASCNEVYWLTQRLRELGYPVSETSRYTDSVVAAVRLFQRANGLSVDGIAGQATQTALYSLAAVRYGGGEEYPTLVRGDRGLALIYTLQQRLKDLGYYSIRVDGIYGSGTQRAVRWFQQVNGLTATGTADSVTQRLLYSSEARPASGWSGGSYVTLSRSNRYNAYVVTLQRRLKALGYLSGSVDGYFGTQTYRAVRSFQSRNGLTVTGVADPYTQEVLYSSSAKAASGSSSGSSSSGYSLLYWGCRGESVRRLQQALLDAGYTQVRKADGIYGQWTYDAVRAFQRDRGLSVDGIAGRNTQNALYGTSY